MIQPCIYNTPSDRHHESEQMLLLQPIRERFDDFETTKEKLRIWLKIMFPTLFFQVMFSRPPFPPPFNLNDDLSMNMNFCYYSRFRVKHFSLKFPQVRYENYKRSLRSSKIHNEFDWLLFNV
jgi:hypothetical protein